MIQTPGPWLKWCAGGSSPCLPRRLEWPIAGGILKWQLIQDSDKSWNTWTNLQVCQIRKIFFFLDFRQVIWAHEAYTPVSLAFSLSASYKTAQMPNLRHPLPHNPECFPDVVFYHSKSDTWQCVPRVILHCTETPTMNEIYKHATGSFYGGGNYLKICVALATKHKFLVQISALNWLSSNTTHGRFSLSISELSSANSHLS